MKHFTQAEFQGWFPLMNKDLLEKLDELRELCGSAISLSPAEGAIGRRMGLSKRSYHNLDYHGSVMAVDVMPAHDDLAHMFKLAKQVGFGGIGLYPHWKPRHGLHLDVRPKKHKQRWVAHINCTTGVQEYTYL